MNKSQSCWVFIKVTLQYSTCITYFILSLLGISHRTITMEDPDLTEEMKDQSTTSVQVLGHPGDFIAKSSESGNHVGFQKGFQPVMSRTFGRPRTHSTHIHPTVRCRLHVAAEEVGESSFLSTGLWQPPQCSLMSAIFKHFLPCTVSVSAAHYMSADPACTLRVLLRQPAPGAVRGKRF